MTPRHDDKVRLALLGARSPVGDAVIAQLTEATPFVRFSRQSREADEHGEWLLLGASTPPSIATVISLMPIWALAEHHTLLETMRVRRLVALSSTSRFTKQDSARAIDRELADRLRRGEDETIEWTHRAGVELVLLRPTMIYGHENDGNVSSMRRVLRRFRVFPVVGSAAGRRQPVHVADVGWAAVRVALDSSTPYDRAYTISGAEILSYRAMVDKVRATVPGPTFVIRVPAGLFTLVERCAPQSRTAHLAAGMADRMSTDMVFDHREAADAFGYKPRAFDPRLSWSRVS